MSYLNEILSNNAASPISGLSLPTPPDQLKGADYFDALIKQRDMADTANVLEQLQLIPLDNLSIESIKKITGIEVISNDTPAEIRMSLVPKYEDYLQEKTKSFKVSLIKGGVPPDTAVRHCKNVLDEVKQAAREQHKKNMQNAESTQARF